MARPLLLALVLILSACGKTGEAPRQAQAGNAPAASAPTAGAPTAGAQATSAPAASPSAPVASKPAATTQSSTWDRNLLALLPQIDACIAKQNDAREISYAGERNGAVFVRMSGAQNEFDCTVRGGVAEVSRRNEALTVEGENAAIFVRGPGENPGGECYQAPEVHDANGALVGWMIDPEGC